MTKKDFELIAQAVREAREGLGHDGKAGADAFTLNRVSDRLCRALSATNGRFDRDRFLRACGVEQ